MAKLRISIVIPCLNEASVIADTLRALQPLRQQGHEILLSDGGSQDGTPELASPWIDRLVTGARGRAAQMNAGAKHAQGNLLLFLHADTRLPETAMAELIALSHRDKGNGEGDDTCDDKEFWGRFDVRLSGDRWGLRWVEALMNWRSRWTGIATGDQAIFVTPDLFRRLGGYAVIPLMEDVELSKRLKRITPPHCLRSRVITSSRRWDERGLVKTVLSMWWIRLQYFLGVSPQRLVRQYQGVQR